MSGPSDQPVTGPAGLVPPVEPSDPLEQGELLELLRHGQLEPEGQLVDASNTTLRCLVTLAGRSTRCVYKPVAGERPLWDFPDGTLAGREVAAYLVSEVTGWQLVPPTVHRDGPLGPGACQLWVVESGEPLVGFIPAAQLPTGWHRIVSARDDEGTAYLLAHADDPRLSRMAIFDAVINNADRKGGHVLTVGDHLYGVDHGVCFHTLSKLRTVLWGWAHQPLPAETVPTLIRLAEGLAGRLGEQLSEHLTRAEIAALGERIARLRTNGRFPRPSREWPAIPWPPV